MANPKPSGFANTKAGKNAILDRTRALIQSSSLIITIPIDGVTKEKVDFLRKELPKSTKATVVKNSLMRIAVKETQFAALGDSLRDENMFLFIVEGEAKATYEGLKRWRKEVKRTEPEFDAKYAVMEGVLYQTKAIEAVVNLPTKKQLITKIAMGIKAVPTKLGRGIKAVPNKLGRALNAIKIKLQEEADAAGVPAAVEEVVAAVEEAPAAAEGA
jgi:large subunit ribosomal protein L10